MKASIRAHSAPWHMAIELSIFSDDRKTRVKEIVLEERDQNFEHAPSFSLDLDQAQTLMDDLWHSGIRPTNGSGSAGAMRAVERHLEDMRTLVFQKPTPVTGTSPPQHPTP